MNFVPNVELTRTHGLGNPNGNYIEWLGPLIWPPLRPPFWFLCIMREIPGYGFVAFWASGSHLVIGRPFAFRLRPIPLGNPPGKPAKPLNPMMPNNCRKWLLWTVWSGKGHRVTSAARQFVQPSAVRSSCSWAPIYIIISGKFAAKNLRFPWLPLGIVLLTTS